VLDFSLTSKRKPERSFAQAVRRSLKALVKRNRIVRFSYIYGSMLALDLLTILLGLEGAVAIRFFGTPLFATMLNRALLPCLLIGVSYSVVFHVIRLNRRLWKSAKYITTVIQSVLLSAALVEGFRVLNGSAIGILPTGIVLGASLLAVLLLCSIKMLRLVVNATSAHNINLADLLEREIVPLHSEEAYSILKGQVVLVTGAAGSIGSELCRQLLNYEPTTLIALDTNETGLFDLAQSLRLHPSAPNLLLRIGDITDVKNMDTLFNAQRPQVIFHAAAYKHVPLLEQHPDQAVRTNSLGTYHLCRLAQHYRVERFVFVSTDKAADPKSVLGASKRVGEMIIQAMAKSMLGETRFCAVRFGNVIGSRGSVVPTFSRQIEQGGPVTITDSQTTRYFMTIPEACGLVILTATLAKQGELYLLDMGEPIRIVDIARKMVHARGLRVGRDIPISYIGLRPGERLHETLVASDETLQPTAHHKILCVTNSVNIPTYTAIESWVSTLNESLLTADQAQIRACLFAIVRLHEQVAVH